MKMDVSMRIQEWKREMGGKGAIKNGRGRRADCFYAVLIPPLSKWNNIERIQLSGKSRAWRCIEHAT